MRGENEFERAETPEPAVDGKQVIAEYEHLKECIVADNLHTQYDGKATVVKDSLVIIEGSDVVDKIRGGSVQWEEDYLNQPCTRVDDDPLTYDRISLERTIQVNGELRGKASIIYSETTETFADGDQLVVEKRERYTQIHPDGDLTGERFIKVASPGGHILAHHHYRSNTPTPNQ